MSEEKKHREEGCCSEKEGKGGCSSGGGGCGCGSGCRCSRLARTVILVLLGFLAGFFMSRRCPWGSRKCQMPPHPMQEAPAPTAESLPMK